MLQVGAVSAVADYMDGVKVALVGGGVSAVGLAASDAHSVLCCVDVRLFIKE